MRRKRTTHSRRDHPPLPWPVRLGLRAAAGLAAVAVLALLAGYGPVQTRAGALLEVRTAQPDPAASPGGQQGKQPAKATQKATAGIPERAASLTLSDRDLLARVRLAGLWEIPAGRMAAKKGVDPRVRQVGAQIAAQHEQLNAFVVAAADQLHVILPDKPNADQQLWLGEMQRAQGAEFDRVFVDRLRVAHGKIFPAVASVRAGTRDPVVRGLASRANDFVLQHLTLLESTRLVDYDAVAPPSDYRPSMPAVDQPIRYSAAWAVLAIAAVAGLVGLARVISPRTFGHGRRSPALAGPAERGPDDLSRHRPRGLDDQRWVRTDQFT